MRNSSTNLTTIVVDIVGTLLTFPQQTKETNGSSPIPSSRRLMATSPWMAYERGELEEEQCFAMLSRQFGFDPTDLKEVISATLATVDYDSNILIMIQQLRQAHSGSLRIFGTWKCARPNYQRLRARWTDEFFSAFDAVFMSFELGLLPPSLGFYRRVLDAAAGSPSNAILVDKDVRNLTTAGSLGMRTINLSLANSFAQAIESILDEPLPKATAFLQLNAKRLHPFTECGTELRENYVQLLILETTQDSNLVELPRPRCGDQTWNYYIEQPTFTKLYTPDDLDTTALALQVIPPDDSAAHQLLDQMLECVNKDGVIQVYFDHTRPRVDPVVCLSVLSAFYKYKRGHQLQLTLDWVYHILLHRAYLHGSYYYRTPEWFLFWFDRFLRQASLDTSLERKLRPLLKDRIQERIGIPGDSMSLALRLTVCISMGVKNFQDLEQLKKMQCQDGGWENSHMLSIPIVGKKVYERGFTTALAIQVLKESDRLEGVAILDDSENTVPRRRQRLIDIAKSHVPRRVRRWIYDLSPICQGRLR